MANRAHLSAGMGVARRPQDFYATPEWCTEALLAQEQFWGTVYEPAVGEGHIAKVLNLRSDLHILGSDLYKTVPHTEDFGKTFTDVPIWKVGDSGVDFLDSKQVNRFLLKHDNSPNYYPDHIITNPPFKHTEGFILQAKHFAKYKIAMLMKLNHLAGKGRLVDIWEDKKFPLKKVLVFARRIKFEGYSCSTTLEMCWMIFERGFEGLPYIQWIP